MNDLVASREQPSPWKSSRTTVLPSCAEIRGYIVAMDSDVISESSKWRSRDKWRPELRASSRDPIHSEDSPRYFNWKWVNGSGNKSRRPTFALIRSKSVRWGNCLRIHVNSKVVCNPHNSRRVMDLQLPWNDIPTFQTVRYVVRLTKSEGINQFSWLLA